MNKITLPNVNPVPEASLQSLSAPGVRICGPKSVNGEAPFTISGRFIVDEKEFDRLGGSPHRDLVLTVLRDPMYGSYLPLKDCLFFKDDTQKLSGTYSGWFTLNVWAYSGFQTEGTYHVRVSLGEALSNVIETKVVKKVSTNSWENTA
jgi:hypothetical protein